MSIPVQVKILDPRMKLPEFALQYAKPGDAGLDLRACIKEPIILRAGAPSVLISTGLSVYVANPDYVAFILPRSGLGHKHGLIVANNVGVIDAPYQGDLMMSLCIRPGHDDYTINPMDRVAQLVLLPVAHGDFNIVENFSDVTQRGEGGFGSSGKNEHAA